MSARNLETVITLMALACVSGPSSAAAAAKEPASANSTASASSLGGPVVPGVCLLSQEAVFAHSKVGIAANQRLRQLAQQAQTELDTEKTSIESDAKALDGQRVSLSAADFQARQQALAQRAQTYQAEVQEKARQVEATRAKAVSQIGVAVQPIAADVYRSRGCGLLITRDAVLGGNLANDLTPAVVAGLDAKLTTISFDLEPPGVTSPPGGP